MNLILSTAPHIRSPRSTQKLMFNVAIALLPSAAAGVYFFGMDALITLLVSMATAVLSEFLWQKINKQTVRVGDGSALLTGLILGLIVSPTVPWWAVMIGSAFAILIVKQLFGGIGDNFLNPAMAARAVLLASWPAYLTKHVLPSCWSGADAVTSATPLSGAMEASYLDLFLGKGIPGAIGETCKAAILLGLVFLLLTKTITWRIPVVTMASACAFSWIFGTDPLETALSGGILFAAVFMATDYATSPMSSRAQLAYAAGIGLITVVIRNYGSYPEGVTYAVLFMNILTPLLDRCMPHRIYGYQKKREAKKA